jgi:hypothetical protein
MEGAELCLYHLGPIILILWFSGNRSICSSQINASTHLQGAVSQAWQPTYDTWDAHNGSTLSNYFELSNGSCVVFPIIWLSWLGDDWDNSQVAVFRLTASSSPVLMIPSRFWNVSPAGKRAAQAIWRNDWLRIHFRWVLWNVWHM